MSDSLQQLVVRTVDSLIGVPQEDYIEAIRQLRQYASGYSAEDMGPYARLKYQTLIEMISTIDRLRVSVLDTAKHLA